MEQLRLKQLQNATFEDITEVDDVVVASSASTTGGLVPTVSTLQRRHISNTFNKFPYAKRKRFDDTNDDFDVDDPETIAEAGNDEDDMVMYDPNESIIEGPDDNEDNL